MTDAPRHNWTTQEVETLLALPLFDLIDQARTIHKAYHPEGSVQLASLMSITTGGCPEDCGYCPQSAHNQAAIDREGMIETEKVLEAAQRAKDLGASRFCMGAAWREVRDGEEFDRVIDMVSGVRDLGMEACVTLGMINADQARRLAEAGLNSYNHNLDTSPEFYGEIITTRDYESRLETLGHVRAAGIGLCVGGIIGMGENDHDRARMLEILANLDPHPESVPINALVAVEGTPLEDRPKTDPLELVRMCATARILMPASRVRLSAGRRSLTKEAQILCFLAGANSIFYGETLLTTANADCDEDRALLAQIGAPLTTPGEDETSPQSRTDAA